MTKIEPTGDEEADKAARELGLEVALEYKAQEKKTTQRLKKALNKLKDKVGEEDPQYLEAKAAYYKQKAIFEQVKKILGNTGQASQEAAAEVDKARFGGELAQWMKDEIAETIDGYNNWSATGDANADRAAG
jgi:vacuolar-type H+-ATPase subunit E/Vma4